MTCPNCERETSSVKTVIYKGQIVDGCDKCLSTVQKGSGTTAQFYKRAQQTQFRRELSQPVDPKEFSRAYPEKAREMYGDEQFRKFSQ